MDYKIRLKEIEERHITDGLYVPIINLAVEVMMEENERDFIKEACTIVMRWSGSPVAWNLRYELLGVAGSDKILLQHSRHISWPRILMRVPERRIVRVIKLIVDRNHNGDGSEMFKYVLSNCSGSWDYWRKILNTVRDIYNLDIRSLRKELKEESAELTAVNILYDEEV